MPKKTTKSRRARSHTSSIAVGSIDTDKKPLLTTQEAAPKPNNKMTNFINDHDVKRIIDRTVIEIIQNVEKQSIHNYKDTLTKSGVILYSYDKDGQKQINTSAIFASNMISYIIGQTLKQFQNVINGLIHYILYDDHSSSGGGGIESIKKLVSLNVSSNNNDTAVATYKSKSGIFRKKVNGTETVEYRFDTMDLNRRLIHFKDDLFQEKPDGDRVYNDLKLRLSRTIQIYLLQIIVLSLYDSINKSQTNTSILQAADVTAKSIIIMVAFDLLNTLEMQKKY